MDGSGERVKQEKLRRQMELVGNNLNGANGISGSNNMNGFGGIDNMSGLSIDGMNGLMGGGSVNAMLLDDPYAALLGGGPRDTKY